MDGGSAYDAPTGRVYIDPLDARNKVTTAHEMGHMLLHLASWDTNTDPSLTRIAVAGAFSVNGFGTWTSYAADNGVDR